MINLYPPEDGNIALHKSLCLVKLKDKLLFNTERPQYLNFVVPKEQLVLPVYSAVTHSKLVVRTL